MELLEYRVEGLRHVVGNVVVLMGVGNASVARVVILDFGVRSA
jgi:hypothetical protein